MGGLYMALVSCPECGKQVSSIALACPECGYSVKEHFNNTNEPEQKTIPEMPKDNNAPDKRKKIANRKLILITSAILVVIISISILLLKPLSPEQVYKIVSPATVEIHVKTDNGESIGTGFFDDNNGTIITNYHVIEYGYEGTVYVKNAGAYDIKSIIGFDEKLDIAIIQIYYKNEVVLNKKTDNLKVGETVYAFGSSEGLTDSFSSGIISAIDRKIENTCFIQTTAPISHGNSGGPLVDSKGNVIGITSAGVVEGQNLNLAIPVYDIEKISRDKNFTFRQFYKATNPDKSSSSSRADELYNKYSTKSHIGINTGEYQGTVHIRYCSLVKDILDYWMSNQKDSNYTAIGTSKQDAFDLGYEICPECKCVSEN